MNLYPLPTELRLSSSEAFNSFSRPMNFTLASARQSGIASRDSIGSPVFEVMSPSNEYIALKTIGFSSKLIFDDNLQSYI